MKTKILQGKILLTILVVCAFMLGFAGIGTTTVYAASGQLYYVSDNSVVINSTIEYTVVENSDSDVTWNGTNYYYVNSNVVINGSVTVPKNLFLIIADGASLTVNNGIKISKNYHSLTVCGQSNQTGVLTVNGGDGYAISGGHLNIESGIVNAAGIACWGCNCNIDGGTVTVTGNGIGADKFVLSNGAIVKTSSVSGSQTLNRGILLNGVNQAQAEAFPLSGNTLTQDYTLPTNASLTVARNTTLTIPETVSLINQGTINNQGTITNNGVMLNEGTMSGNGVGGKAVKCTVTFNMNGHGTPIETPQTVAYGTVLSANPTEEGYLFLGWYTDEQLTQAFDISSPITTSLDLYAKWEAHTHEYVSHECWCGDKIHSFDSITHLCSCGATNHSYDEVTHKCTCGAENHTFDNATHLCSCGENNHTFDAVTQTCTCGAIDINEISFRDANFRDYVLANVDRDNNGILTTDEYSVVTDIDVNGKEITTLKGIEYFTALEKLICHTNQLQALDVSNNTELITLNCSANDLEALDVSSNTKLTTLICISNNLKALDVSKNTALTSLSCSNNQLQSLDVSNNTELTILACANNYLTTLDMSNNNKLTTLNCSNNCLPSLNLSANSNIYEGYGFTGGDQTVSITVISNLLLFNMSSLDSSFDSSKATITTAGASFDGNMLVLTEKLTTVTYTYATGQSVPSMTVTLSITCSEQASAREVEFQKGTDYIQWRYVGEDDTAWRNLVALSEITGAAGTNGTNGTPGSNGENGKEIELQIGTDGKTLQWRYVGDTDWANLFDLSTLKGADGTNGTNGDEIELRKGETHIEWKYKTEADAAWRELISLDSLKGDKGEDGREVEFRKTETHIQWKYTSEADTAWRNLVALSEITGAAGTNGTNGDDGDNGTNGKEIELQIAADGKTLQWRYVGDTDWANLFDLSTLKGADGTNGTNGDEIELRKGETHIEWKYKTEADTAWRELVSLDSLKGDKGDKGDVGEKGDKGDKGDTGATGANGVDGVTPHIGENGNWWIGNTDTGVKAAGDDGEDGVDGVTVVSMVIGSVALLGNIGWGVFFIGKKKKWF